MSEAAITFAYGGSQEEWMRDGIRKMRALGFNWGLIYLCTKEKTPSAATAYLVHGSLRSI